MNIDHIGWITDDLELFEKFWCKILKYKQSAESRMLMPMATNLFGIYDEACIRRYKPTIVNGPDIEIHCFDKKSNQDSGTTKFDRKGINHICLHTGGKNSRQKFLNQLPKDIIVHKYNNPKGWENIFIQDYEENWIELREDL